MYQNADEIEKLKKIKVDFDQEMVGAMKQLKELSESRDSMQHDLVTLREVRDAAQEVAEVMEIPKGNENDPLSLVGKLRKVHEAFERYISPTTRQYVGHVLGLVKSYWPTLVLMHLGREPNLIVLRNNSDNIWKKLPWWPTKLWSP